MTGLTQLTLQSDSAAEFLLTQLEPGTTFMLYLYAVNVKGLSSPVILPASTLKEAAKRTVPPSTDSFPGSVASAVAMGSGAGLLLVASISVVACLRCKRRTGNNIARTAEDRETQVAQCSKGSPSCDGAVRAGNHSIPYANSNGRDESAESAGFYHHRPGRPTPGAQHQQLFSTSSTDRRTRLKLPPDFVPMSENIPESCV